MSLIRRKVHKIQVDYVCPKCEKGRMVYQSENSADVDFLHACDVDVCGYEMYLKAEYPHFREQIETWKP